MGKVYRSDDGCLEVEGMSLWRAAASSCHVIRSIKETATFSRRRVIVA